MAFGGLQIVTVNSVICGTLIRGLLHCTVHALPPLKCLCIQWTALCSLPLLPLVTLWNCCADSTRYFLFNINCCVVTSDDDFFRLVIRQYAYKTWWNIVLQLPGIWRISSQLKHFCNYLYKLRFWCNYFRKYNFMIFMDHSASEIR